VISWLTRLGHIINGAISEELNPLSSEKTSLGKLLRKILFLIEKMPKDLEGAIAPWPS
jgi:hypothetical protein